MFVHLATTTAATPYQQIGKDMGFRHNTFMQSIALRDNDKVLIFAEVFVIFGKAALPTL